MTMARKKPIKKDLSITIPSGWGELTSLQVAQVATELFKSQDPDEMVIRLAAKFAELAPRGSIIDANGNRAYCYYHRNTGNVTLDLEQVSAIVEALSWISIDKIEPMAAPSLDGYPTPDHKLRSVTLEQFITGDVAFAAFVGGGNRYALRMLAATFYAREQYDPSRLHLDAERIKRLDDQLYGVFLWFTGVKVLFSKEFPEVFGRDGDKGDAPSGGEYLLGILSSLNGGDATKNNQLKALNAYEAFYELNQKITESKRNV